MGDDYSWAWGGNQDSSRSSTSHTGHIVNQRRSTARGYDTTGTGMPDDRSAGAPSRANPLGRNITAWNDYVGASQRLEEMQRAAINNGMARYSYNNQYVEWDRRQDLLRARSLRATIQSYRDNQTSCSGGNQVACNAVGRRDSQDRAWHNPNQESYRDYFLHTNRENPNPPPPPAETPTETPGDIMGDGTSQRPAEADTREERCNTAGGFWNSQTRECVAMPSRTAQQRCEDGGGRWSSDGNGACFHDAPAVPSPEPVHTDEPDERTGEQLPDCPQGGRRNLLGILDSNCHDRQVNPTAQGGGSHSGKDGSKTMAGSDEVVHFDTGGKEKTLSRQENPVRQMINLIAGLQDPYGEFRKCKTEKRIVE